MLRFLKKLRRREDGFAAFEAIVIVPMVMAAVTLTFTAFDHYRIESRNHKASIAIADALSRETKNITPAKTATLFNLHTALMRGGAGDRALRISVVEWREDTKEHKLHWSQVRAQGTLRVQKLTKSELGHYVPVLAPGEVVILAETFVEYDAPFRVGELLQAFRVKPRMYRHVTVMRPRNAPQVCYSTIGENSTSRTC